MFVMLTLVALVCTVLDKMSTKLVYENLGKRIKGLRKSLGQTQDKMARQMGISRASLANIEAGRQQVLVHHLFAFARALQIESPSQLLPTLAELSRDDSDAKSLPLPQKGLTKSQRDEVLSFFTNNISNNNVRKRESKWIATKKAGFEEK